MCNLKMPMKLMISYNIIVQIESHKLNIDLKITINKNILLVMNSNFEN